MWLSSKDSVTSSVGSATLGNKRWARLIVQLESKTEPSVDKETQLHAQKQ